MIEQHVRIALPASVGALAAAVIAALAFSSPAAIHMPTFLAHSLGDPQDSVSLVRTPAQNTTVNLLDQGGVSVHQNRGASIALRALLTADPPPTPPPALP